MGSSVKLRSMSSSSSSSSAVGLPPVTVRTVRYGGGASSLDVLVYVCRHSGGAGGGWGQTERGVVNDGR